MNSEMAYWTGNKLLKGYVKGIIVPGWNRQKSAFQSSSWDEGLLSCETLLKPLVIAVDRDPNRNEKLTLRQRGASGLKIIENSSCSILHLTSKSEIGIHMNFEKRVIEGVEKSALRITRAACFCARRCRRSEIRGQLAQALEH